MELEKLDQPKIKKLQEYPRLISSSYPRVKVWSTGKSNPSFHPVI